MEEQEGGHCLSGQANVLLAPGGARAAVPVGGRPWGAVGPGAQQPGQGQGFWESREGPLGHSPAQGLLNPWRELQPQTGVGRACLFLGKEQGQELVGGLLAEGLLRDRPWPPPGRQLHEDRLPPQPPAQRHGSRPGTRLRPLPSGSAQPRTWAWRGLWKAAPRCPPHGLIHAPVVHGDHLVRGHILDELLPHQGHEDPPAA